MRHIKSLQEIRDMARGAVFLGSGGGGDPYVGEVFLARQLEQGRRPVIITAGELADDAFVLSIAGVGAPTVLVEHLVSEQTLLRLLAQSEAYYQRKVDALISAEIGGANSMFPLALGARTGIPVIDADGMGRAFPHLEMTTFSVFGCRATPALLVDDSGNSVIMSTISDRIAEDVARAVTSSLGAMTFSAIYPMSGRQAKDFAVHGTISQTLEIGATIRKAREESDDPVRALLEHLDDPERERHARLVFAGKIQDVRHETRDGWHWGSVRIANTQAAPQELSIEIQNEYLVARQGSRTVAIVPDLISVLDVESAEPLTAEMLRYGQRVAVIGYSAAPIMRRPECLAVFGPRLFKINEEFQPVEALNPG
jgi:uncharacterized protein